MQYAHGSIAKKEKMDEQKKPNNVIRKSKSNYWGTSLMANLVMPDFKSFIIIFKDTNPQSVSW